MLALTMRSMVVPVMVMVLAMMGRPMRLGHSSAGHDQQENNG